MMSQDPSAENRQEELVGLGKGIGVLSSARLPEPVSATQNRPWPQPCVVRGCFVSHVRCLGVLGLVLSQLEGPECQSVTQRFPRPMLLAEERRRWAALPWFFVLGAESQSSLFPGVGATWLAVCSVLLCPLLCLGRELTDSNSICLTPTGVSLLSALAGSPVLQCSTSVPFSGAMGDSGWTAHISLGLCVKVRPGALYLARQSWRPGRVP